MKSPLARLAYTDSSFQIWTVTASIKVSNSKLISLLLLLVQHDQDAGFSYCHTCASSSSEISTATIQRRCSHFADNKLGDGYISGKLCSWNSNSGLSDLSLSDPLNFPERSGLLTI